MSTTVTKLGPADGEQTEMARSAQPQAALLTGPTSSSSSPSGDPSVLPQLPTSASPSPSPTAAPVAASHKTAPIMVAAAEQGGVKGKGKQDAAVSEGNFLTRCLEWKTRVPPPLAAAKPAGAGKNSPAQKALINDILHCNLDALFTVYNNVDWNFTENVVGRTAPQSPLALLLRPELNYGNLSRMTKKVQYELLQHVLSLPQGITPRLDSHDMQPGFPYIRQTMSVHVIQAIYQGRVDLVELLYETAADRARQGTGVAFDLRERFFPSRITLLHMAAHDGRLEMCKWLVEKWKEAAEKDPRSQISKEFVPDIVDAAGQTPLFWTFARGTVDVNLARYFVEECACDFFRVFELEPNMKVIPTFRPDEDPRQEPKMTGPYYCSPFSLSIEFAPGFCEEQLKKKTENMGSRFQWAIMKYDYSGITLRPEQIKALQSQTDILNAAEVEKTERLEGKEFLDAATNLLKSYIHRHQHEWNAYLETKAQEKIQEHLDKHEKAYHAKRAKLKAEADKKLALLQAEEDKRHGRVRSVVEVPVAAAPTAAAASVPSPSPKPSTAPPADFLDTRELRFVSPEAPGNRPPKNRWDNFWYDDVPLSAVELMIKHDRRRLLLTAIMIDVQDRLWLHLRKKYFLMLVGYMLFGILFAINTGIWPRTSQMVASNIVTPFAPYSTHTTFVSLYFFCNLGCIVLCCAGFAFHARAIYEGENTSWRGGGITRFLSTLVDNVKGAFRTSSSRLDLAIILCFIVVQFTQWSMVCHVPQFSQLSVCDGSKNPLINPLPEDTLGTYTWFATALHMLLGFKILELASVFEFAGPLLSTLLGMFRDVSRFACIFGIVYCAFTCAMWIILKDVFPAEIPAGLNGPAQAVSKDPQTGQIIFPEARYSYSGAMVNVLLWVFLNFDFDSFNHTTLPGSASLGRIIFLMFLLSMVLVMLNLMIAMFSTTYGSVVKDAEGEWHIRYSSVLCQLLRISGEDAKLAREYVLEMGVDNNCGKDRARKGDKNVELFSFGSGGGGAEDDEDSSDDVSEAVGSLATTLSKMRQEQRAMNRRVEKLLESEALKKKFESPKMGPL